MTDNELFRRAKRILAELGTLRAECDASRLFWAAALLATAEEQLRLVLRWLLTRKKP